MVETAIVELKGVEKIYRRGAEDIHALRDINLTFYRGEFISVTGPSGSGKTTLLHILGCLDSSTKGAVKIDGIEVKSRDEKELVKLRREKIGFVFQQFYLIPRLSVMENVSMPLLFNRKRVEKDKIKSLIQMVGLGDRIEHTPNQLSGGEMQRVAIARALVNNPQIILADEPTGNLDTENSMMILDILKSLNDSGITIIVATHNSEIAAMATRILKIKDGRLQ